MSKYLTGKDFLAGIIGAEEDFEIPGVGTVRIRAPGKLEAMRAAETSTGQVDSIVKIIACALVEPKLTEEEITELYHAQHNMIDPLIERIRTMTPDRTDEDAEKKVGSGS